MKKILRGLLAVMAFAVCMAGAISIPSRAEEAYTSENEAEATDAELQTTAGAELATVKNGWVNVKGGRKYYENGKAVKGWKVLSGKTYYFSKKNGQAVTGKKKIGDARYFFDKYGRMQKKVWKVVNGKKFFFGYNGQAKTGFCTINGNRYYFNDKGELQKSKFFKVNGKTFFVGYKGHTFSGLKKVKGTYYYFSKKGVSLIHI